MQRYKIVSDGMPNIEPSEDGVVVLYEDHEKAYEELMDKIIALLEEKVNEKTKTV